MADPSPLDRRAFLRSSATLIGGTLAGAHALAAQSPASRPKPPATRNKLPPWKGFNLLDFFNPDPRRSREPTPEEHFRWMKDWGFNFVRIPMAYPVYLKFDRDQDITLDRMRKLRRRNVREIDRLVDMGHKYGIHVSLNLHRAPGFCVNAGFNEPYNLWKDERAMDDFCWHWNFWARRYRKVSREYISFDLLNEPCVREDMNDQHAPRGPIPGPMYRAMALRALEAIRGENPDHLIIADGNNVGQEVIPEITDLDIGQSCRGYYPGAISHHKAPWVFKDPSTAPQPRWPGQVGDAYFSRDMLEAFYQPWIELVQQGVGVHCGECGCWNQTPHEVFLAWFGDVLDILSSHGIGFALWEFRGDFGLLDSGRRDVDYEDWHGHQLDRKLLELLMAA